MPREKACNHRGLPCAKELSPGNCSSSGKKVEGGQRHVSCVAMKQSHAHAEEDWNLTCFLRDLFWTSTADKDSSLPPRTEVHLTSLMFSLLSYHVSWLPLSPSASYFPCTLLWLNLWVPSLLKELSVSGLPFVFRLSIAILIRVEFYFSQLHYQWNDPRWSSSILHSTSTDPLFFSLTV